MVKHERGLEGAGGTPTGGSGNGTGRVARKNKFKFWLSHRGGPFLIHVNETCDPRAGGCYNDIGNLIEQGFAPCPKCMA